MFAAAAPSPHTTSSIPLQRQVCVGVDTSWGTSKWNVSLIKAGPLLSSMANQTESFCDAAQDVLEFVRDNPVFASCRLTDTSQMVVLQEGSTTKLLISDVVHLPSGNHSDVSLELNDDSCLLARATNIASMHIVRAPHSEKLTPLSIPPASAIEEMLSSVCTLGPNPTGSHTANFPLSELLTGVAALDLPLSELLTGVAALDSPPSEAGLQPPVELEYTPSDMPGSFQSPDILSMVQSLVSQFQGSGLLVDPSSSSSAAMPPSMMWSASTWDGGAYGAFAEAPAVAAFVLSPDAFDHYVEESLPSMPNASTPISGPHTLTICPSRVSRAMKADQHATTPSHVVSPLQLPPSLPPTGWRLGTAPAVLMDAPSNAVAPSPATAAPPASGRTGRRNAVCNFTPPDPQTPATTSRRLGGDSSSDSDSDTPTYRPGNARVEVTLLMMRLNSL